MEKLNKNSIETIINTALEGGINYWCGGVEVIGDYLGEYASDHVANGGSIIIYDLESPEKWTLSKDMLIIGFTKWLMSDSSKHINSDKSVDWANFDAQDADQIFQLSIFGKLIFG